MIVSPAFIVRKKSLRDRSLDIRVILGELGHDDGFEESDDLISVQPLFGSDAVMAFVRAFERHGLVYVDDFYVVEIDLPDWLQLQASLASD